MIKERSASRVMTGRPWEARVGYCRAIRRGPMIWVSGCTAVREDGTVFARGDAERQARKCLNVIDQALRELGADLDDVVRTRMFVTDIARWEEFGRAHAEAFEGNPPATSMVEVAQLIHPDMLIEIEADAYAPERLR